MQKHEIHDLCIHVRSKLEKLRLTNEIVGFGSFQSFPTACCTITSLVMMYYLSNYKGIPKSDLVLLANGDISNNSHAWFTYKNFHIDLTGDQFNKPKIIISEQYPWPKMSCTKHPFEKEEFNVEYENKLIEVCKYLDS